MGYLGVTQIGPGREASHFPGREPVNGAEAHDNQNYQAGCPGDEAPGKMQAPGPEEEIGATEINGIQDCLGMPG